MTLMTTLKNSDTLPSVEEACVFLSDYAAWLMGCGATCIRVEKNVCRMARRWDMTVEMILMPNHVHLSLWDAHRAHACHTMDRIRPAGISFHLNTLLSELSWAVADRKVGFEEAKECMQRVVATKPEPPVQVWMLASLANLSFCRLFGGDGVSMLIVLMATLVGYRVKQVMLQDGFDVRLVFFCSAFFSSVIGSAGYVFGWGGTPELALGTSVLYLIPGIPYINSVSDLLDGHYLSAFSRFMHAAVLTACLSAGLCGGLILMDLEWFW